MIHGAKPTNGLRSNQSFKRRTFPNLDRGYRPGAVTGDAWAIFNHCPASFPLGLLFNMAPRPAPHVDLSGHVDVPERAIVTSGVPRPDSSCRVSTPSWDSTTPRGRPASELG